MSTEKSEKEAVKKDRNFLNSRLASRFPDKSFDNDDDFYGQINDDYDEMDRLRADNDKHVANAKKLTDLFNSDPESADFLMNWNEGKGGILGNLTRTYGTDRLREALDDPEKMEELAKQNKEYLENVAKEKGYEEEYNKNLAASFEAEDKAIESGDMSEEDVARARESLLNKVKNGVMGKWSVEDLKAELHSLDHDKDVATASEEGEIRGRNAKIDEKKKMKMAGDGTANLNGGGLNKPTRNEGKDLGAIGNFGATSIYERGNEKRKRYY